ncbi:helix-turn-helix transcriptional regulator [Actinophytocola oryzae]|uniref:Transcriptional regulator n=1 Tax=Actinophytocola oryzae TaxID=502181 RepID=A0A4R7W401_9PSEU|nr:WYL domain-containing protein [Actinophytocola oryzae]TDV57396.1 transcriptional regulator [Actinophytocola oryzae]
MPAHPSPTARALRALEVLQTRAVVPAAELATRLEVTPRATRRYVGILREAGIPVESVRGPHGGYRLSRRTRLPPVVFTETEALGLVMAVLDGRPAAASGDDLVGGALAKVIRALPEDVGRQATALRDHAAAAPDRYAATPDPATTSALVGAVAARVGVIITYRGERGVSWEAEVDPWAIVARHGRWYLLCHSHRAAATRTYRIDRVRAVRRTARSFTPPENLDPVVTLEENLGTGWQYTTRVAFDAPLEEVRRWARPPMGTLERSGVGCVLVGSTRNPAMYAQEWLATAPFPFHVQGGPELRAAMAELAARCAAALTDDRRTASAGSCAQSPPSPSTS